MAWTDFYVDPNATGANNGTSQADAWTSLSAAISGVGAGPATTPTRVNVKAATYTQNTTGLTFNTAGATTAPVWWRGYKTTPGDQDSNGNAVAGTDLPDWVWTTGQLTISGAHQYFSNIQVDSQCVLNGSGAVNVSGANCTFYRFRSINTGASANGLAISLGSGESCIACYFKATTSASSCVKAGGNGQFSGCYVTGGAVGLLAATNVISVNDCIFDQCGGDAIQATTSPLTVAGCSFYAPLGNGINWTGTPSSVAMILNNYFENVNQAGKAAIANSSGTVSNLIRRVSNAYFNCTTNTSGMGDIPGIFSDGTLPTSAFVAPGSGNFGVDSDAQSIGFPGTVNGFEHLPTTQGYMSFGAVQPQAGGGATYVINKSINNYFYDSPEP